MIAPRPLTAALASLAALVAVVAGGCAADDDAGPAPMVDRIDDAIFAVESFYEAPQDYFSISADLERVEVVVARDAGAEQAFWDPDEGLVEPRPIEVPFVDAFDSGDLDFDPDDVFDQIRSELPEATILDFAITGAGDDAVVYDARVQSSAGGVLLVLLGPDGQIRGTQDATPGLGD